MIHLCIGKMEGKKMKVIVVGLGSMGRRRIRLIKQYNPDLEIIGIDSNAERAKDVGNQLSIDTCKSIEEACSKGTIDCGFVCTSPLSHYAIISQLIKYGIHVFTEINLLPDGYDEFISEKNVKLFLSSTFLYRRDVQWMIERVKKSNKVNYIYHSGQYLPDWHPWENYKHFFVGDKRTNGCREIFAIELPWIIACFGEIKNMHIIKDNISDLQIDYPDNYLLQIEHENGNKGHIIVDVVARKAIRQLEVYNEQLQIYWEGTPASLQEWDYHNKRVRNISTYESIVKDRNYCENIIENAYMDEIDAFFTWLSGDASKVRYDFKKDLKILELIDKIEK